MFQIYLSNKFLIFEIFFFFKLKLEVDVLLITACVRIIILLISIEKCAIEAVSLFNFEQCMPHVMHLFLSPGEGGEFVGWQGRQMRSFTITYPYAYTSSACFAFILHHIRCARKLCWTVFSYCFSGNLIRILNSFDRNYIRVPQS